MTMIQPLEVIELGYHCVESCLFLLLCVAFETACPFQHVYEGLKYEIVLAELDQCAGSLTIQFLSFSFSSNVLLFVSCTI